MPSSSCGSGLSCEKPAVVADPAVEAAVEGVAEAVVEAVVENMELKQKLFAEYDDKVIKTKSTSCQWHHA